MFNPQLKVVENLNKETIFLIEKGKINDITKLQ